jgi:hypothetical protein
VYEILYIFLSVFENFRGNGLHNPSWDVSCKNGNSFIAGVAQIVARRLAVRQARVRILAQHPRRGPLQSGND